MTNLDTAHNTEAVQLLPDAAPIRLAGAEQQPQPWGEGAPRAHTVVDILQQQLQQLLLENARNDALQLLADKAASHTVHGRLAAALGHEGALALQRDWAQFDLASLRQLTEAPEALSPVYTIRDLDGQTVVLKGVPFKPDAMDLTIASCETLATEAVHLTKVLTQQLHLHIHCLYYSLYAYVTVHVT